MGGGTVGGAGGGTVGGAGGGAAEGCPQVEAIPICTTIMVCEFILAFGPGLATSIRVGNVPAAAHANA